MTISDITIDLWDYLKACGKPLALYGTGDGADKIMSVLEQRGLYHLIKAVFASDGFVRNRQFKGFQVESFDAVQNRLGAGNFITLVCFGSSRPEVIENIHKIASMCELYAPDVPVCGDGLFDMEYYEANRQALETAYSWLEDDASRECFRCMINYKLSGDIKYLEACESSSNESDSLLQDLPAGARIMDLGAYNGDTLDLYMNRFPGISQAIAVEPERHSYKKLLACCEKYAGRAVPVNAIIASSCGNAMLSGSHGRGSRDASIVSPGAGINDSSKLCETPLTTIDTLSQGQRIDFIKFDVEGAESAAILGGTQTITQYRPQMLVACYHKNEDLFAIPRQIKGLRNDYKIFLRHQPYVPGWETNFYFV